MQQTIGTISPSMRLNPLSGSGKVLVERYRLEERLSGPDPLKGSMWPAEDVLAGDLPVDIRQLESPAAQQRLQGVWPQLQTLSHPQLPRCSELVELDGALWLVHDWQDGIAYDLLLRQRRFDSVEVLLLIHQVLPVLAVLHGCGLVHGDVNPQQLLRRSSDGLPVLLEGGGVQREGLPGRMFPGAISMILGSPLLSCSAVRQARWDAGQRAWSWRQDSIGYWSACSWRHRSAVLSRPLRCCRPWSWWFCPLLNRSQA